MPRSTVRRVAPRAKPPAGRRADFGAPADAWFAARDDAVGDLARRVRTIVRATAPDLSEALKWGMPTYSHGREIVCAIGAFKAHVSLIFHRGVELSDPGGRLEGTASCMRGCRIRAAADLDRGAIAAWVREAVAVARRTSGRRGGRRSEPRRDHADPDGDAA